MFRTALLVSLLAGSASAATYTFEDENGEFLISTYGGLYGRTEARALFDSQRAQYSEYYPECLEYANEFGDASDVAYCEQLLDYVDGQYANGNYATFEEFYADEFQGAIDRLDISTWVTDGLTVEAGHYPFFSNGNRASYLGLVGTGGDSTLPRRITFTLDPGQELVSIYLSLGYGDFQDAIVISSGSFVETLTSGFSGTYTFGPEFAGNSTFMLSSGISEYDTGIFAYSFTNLVTRELGVAEVPLPASLPLLGFALFAFAGLRRKRSS